MTLIDVNGYSIVTETVKMISPVFDANFIEYPYVFTVHFNDDVRKTFSFQSEQDAIQARNTLKEKLNGTV